MRRIADALTIVLFLAALAAPSVDACLRPVEARSLATREMRNPAEWPSSPRSLIELRRVPTTFEAWFDDRLGLRDHLLHARAHIYALGFATSPTAQMDLAPDGWTFLRAEHSRESWSGTFALSAATLDGWEEALASRRSACRALGAEHLFMLGPNKESVYSERVPKTWHKFGPTPWETFQARLLSRSDIRVLDLVPALQAARSGDRPEERDFLYLPLGTHWAPRGDHVAYVAMLDALREQLPGLTPPVAFEALERVQFHGFGDNWAYRTYLEDLFTQNMFMVSPPKQVVYPSGQYGDGRRHIIALGDPHGPRGVLLHDSYGTTVSKLLAPHFSRLHCVWSHELDLELIRRERPDVVIELYVERMLVNVEPESMRVDPNPRFDQPWDRTSDVLLVLTREHVERDTEGEGLRQRLAADTTAVVRLFLVDDGGYFVLPRLPRNPEHGLLVRMEIETPGFTEMALLSMVAGESAPRRIPSTELRLEPGLNNVVVSVPHIAGLERLALRPGHIPGRYLLRSLEIRTAPAE